MRQELERVRAENAALKQRIAELEAKLKRLTHANEDLEVEKQTLTALAGMTAKGDAVASENARFKATYDAEQETTRVDTQPLPLKLTQGKTRNHWVSVQYTYPGEDAPASTQQAGVAWIVQTRFSGGIYEKMSEVTFDIDGEAATAPVRDYSRSQQRRTTAGKRGTALHDEIFFVDISPELLRRLARAQVVTGKMENVRFELSREQVATFLAVKQRLELAANATP